MDITTLIIRRNRSVFAGIFSLFATMLLGMIYLDNPRPDAFFKYIGPPAVLGSIVNVVLSWKRAARFDSAVVARKSSVEDRLDELERLKRRDVVTTEEYATNARKS